jgi:hypothetical protein
MGRKVNVMSFDVSHTAGRLLHTKYLLVVIVWVALFFVSARAPNAQSTTQNSSETDQDQAAYVNAHPYFEEPFKELVKHLPELKKLQPDKDQQRLTEILRKTSANVDDFLHYIVDVIAQEKITQQRLSHRGWVTASQKVQDNYLILRRTDPDTQDDNIVEYRMDAEGRPLENIGLYRGYLVTFGFALMANYFSSQYQGESEFRYLGEQKIASRDTFVVAFAQKPGSSLLVRMSSSSGRAVQLLMQGVAWIDKANFQILRIRSDLLAPRPEIGLNHQSTEVTFDPVQLADVSAPLWLPREVTVDLGVREPPSDHQQHEERNYRNEHHYSDYRRYRVSVKMLPPQ